MNFDDHIIRNTEKVKVGQNGLMDPLVVKSHLSSDISIIWVGFLKNQSKMLGIQLEFVNMFQINVYSILEANLFCYYENSSPHI